MVTDIFLFYLFSSLALTSSILVITSTNAVHSVLFLIIVFCNVASLLLMIGAEFFSFLFLIVYVGAIAVLFLFVVMMLNVKTNPIKLSLFSILPIGLLIFLVVINQVLGITNTQFVLLNNTYLLYTPWIKENFYLTNAETIGVFLYTKFSILFILCGLILLVAMIGAIVLTMHQRTNIKKQYINEQLLRNPRKVIKFIMLRK